MTKTPESPETYANHPKSISEIKADKSWNAAQARPRDALIMALRDLDSGAIDPDHIFIAVGHTIQPGVTQTNFYQAGGDYHRALGLIEAAKLKLAISM